MTEQSQERPLPTRIPGDRVFIPEFGFEHTMNASRVWAIFKHEDDPDQQVELSGDPYPDEDLKTIRSPSHPGLFLRRSRVELEGYVHHDATPGVYKCQAITVETYTGRYLSIENHADGSKEIDYAFRVVEEPSFSPRYI